MNLRTVLAWGFFGSAVAVVSCSSNDNSSGAPAGFGVACSSDKDCASYSLLCSDDDECVQCLDDSDCKRSELCTAGLCKTAQTCKSSRDCSRDQVCDEGLSLCVECVSNGDCLNGQACVKNACIKRPTCKTTRDCEAPLVCDPKGFCVECADDGDCSRDQLCRDNACEAPASRGDGGAGPGPSGDGGAGTDTGGTNTGGTPSGGSNGGGASSGGTSASAGGAGSGGSGGSGGSCACTGGDVCTPDKRCVAPTVIDDLFDCDDEILAIEGRSGPWAADADDDINLTFGFGNPGSGWADNSCAAWAIGGIKPSAVDTDFAFIGFWLNDGSAYDLSAYRGLRVTLESDATVQVVLKTTGGGYFDYVLTPITGSNVRSAPFASMNYMAISTETSLDLSTVYEVQFSPVDPTSFGLAVHRVELY